MTGASRLSRIETALASLFPTGVAVAVCDIAAADPAALWPEERAAITGAVPHRLAEFAAGRQAARLALQRLGHPPAALPMGPDRAALWPAGLSGSIAHSAGLAVAVARAGLSLGVDVEDDAPLDADLWPVITSTDEQDRLPVGDTGRLIRQIFAAKEALFKAQEPERRVLFGFDAVSVTLAKDRFDANFRTSVGAFRSGEVIHGRLALVGGLILAGVAR